jgi:hypothetical protein
MNVQRLRYETFRRLEAYQEVERAELMSNFYFKTYDEDGEFINEQPYQFPDLLSAIESAKTEIAEMAADGIPTHHDDAITLEIQNADRLPIVVMKLRYTIEFLQM